MSTDLLASGPMSLPKRAISVASFPETEGDEQPENVAPRAFLFTDIEGSTRLWEMHSVAMRRALAQHDALLFTIAERFEGHVFKTIGDAFCIAFTSPAAAVRAAVEAQLALLARDWGQVGSVLVRMAIHWGDAEARDNDYFGPPLNRSARLRDAGHGGQILVSASVWTALRTQDSLPDRTFTTGEITFLDQGQHKLKDISEAEHVYQVCAPGLPTDFPKLRTPSTHPNNLPASTTSFVGRRAEARAARELLTQPGVRLLTLTGMGGMGKTRLALEIAADVLQMNPQGVWFTDLAPIASPALVLPSILRTCGLRPDPGQAPLEQLSRHFRDARALLVLDTFEQVADAAEDIAALLRATNHLQVLTTSRSLLELSMEYEYAVPPLRSADCVSLFEARSRQVAPEFTLDAVTQPVVEAICLRVDNLPLSIELAAAQMRSLPLPSILSALESSMDVLATRMRDLSPRQRSLRGAIDWSYGLLGEEARSLFRSLSVFVGGFTLEAAEHVCGMSGTTAALLERLRASSLILQQAASMPDPIQTPDGEIPPEGGTGAEDDESQIRFTLLESLRQYGQERLTSETDEADQRRIWDAHTRFFCELAASENALLRGEGQKRAQRTLEREIANIRAAMDRSLKNEDTETAARFVVTLRRFWERQGYITEGLERTERVLERRDALITDPEMEADLAFAAGALATENGRLTQAQGLLEQSVILSRKTGNLAAEARALNGVGTVAYYLGELDKSDASFERALEVKRELGDQAGVAVSLNNLALQAMARGNYDRARNLTEESLSITRSLGDLAAAAAIYNTLGAIQEILGDFPGARKAFVEGRLLSQTLGIPRTEADALINLGSLALHEGRGGDAALLFSEALKIIRPIDDRRGIAAARLGLGRSALWAGNRTAALSHYRESLTLYQEADEKQGVATSLEALAELALTEAKTASSAILFLATARSLRGDTGAHPTPQETHRIAELEQQAGPGEAAPNLEAALLAAERLTLGSTSSA